MNRTTHAFHYQKFGGPEVLSLREIELRAPTSDEAQIRHTAIGVNYLDIYQRNGADPAIPLPATIGVEGVGVVESVGAKQSKFAPGDRVAYVGGPPGAYALARNIPTSRLVKIPDWMDDQTAAALIFKGLTAEYLIQRCVSVQSDQTVMFHAAAGGVGSIACQWLRAKGVTVIGTVGSKEKMDRASENGCDHVFLSGDPDLVKKVREICNGVDVVYDSTGAATYMTSLDCLCPRGTMVSFGATSGLPPEIAVGELAHRGSLYLTRPSIAHYTSDPAEYQQAADNLFRAVSDGIIRAPHITTLNLAEAAHAHTRLEGRKTTGSLILLPHELDRQTMTR